MGFLGGPRGGAFKNIPRLNIPAIRRSAFAVSARGTAGDD